VINIPRLEQLRVYAQRLLDEREAQFAAQPRSLFRQALVETARREVEDLTRQLVEAKQRREVEVVELHLTGPAAAAGSLPLHVLGPLVEAFEDMLVQAGRFIRDGSAKKSLVAEVRSLFDVRLAPSPRGSGSANLFITLNTAPDLFGGSLSEEALARTFGLLATESAEDVASRVGTYGRAGARGLYRFLKTLEEAQLEATLRWLTPTDEERVWQGSDAPVRRLRTTLESIVTGEPEEIAFEGIVYTESIRGKFEVKTHAGFIYSGTVPLEVMPMLVAVSVGEECQGILLETVTRNTTTGLEKRSYELKTIEPAHRTKATKPAQLPLPF
jgi:hypothetical protein